MIPASLRALLTRIASALLRTPELDDDLRAVHQRLVGERGRARADLWLLGQLGRVAPALPGAWMPDHAASWAGEVVRAARGLVRRPGPSIGFGAIVGLGMAAAGFMLQVRTAVLHPDLGLARDTWVVDWVDEQGRLRRDVPVSGDEPWLVTPPGGIDRLLPVRGSRLTLESELGLHRTSIQEVPRGFAAALGVRPTLGSDLAGPGDLLLAGPTWQTRFGGDPSVIGRVVGRLPDGTAVRVVGVAPHSFDGPLCCIRPDGWLVRPEGDGTPLRATLFATGIRDPSAAAAALSRPLEEALGTTSPRVALSAVSESPFATEGGVVAQTFTVLLALSILAFVGTVLNGANVLMADLTDRQRELRICRALGAGPGRLLVRALSETACLAAAAAVIAAVATALLLAVAPTLLPIVQPGSVFDMRVGAAAVGGIAVAAVGSTLAVGVPLALTRARVSRVGPLGRGSRGTRAASTILAGQVALATAVAMLTLVFASTLVDMDGAFVGFRNGHASVYLVHPEPNGSEPTAAAVVAEVEASPGVAAAALTGTLPVYGARVDSVGLPDGRRTPLAVEESTAGYLDVIGLRLVTGSPPRRPDEAALSLDVARTLSAEPDAVIGSVVTVGGAPVTIVGVTEAATWGFREPRPSLYRGRSERVSSDAVLLVVHAPGAPPRPPGPTLQGLGFSVAEFGTMDGLLVRSRVLTELLARLAVLFSAICLGVALAGIHGHFLRWVRRRDRELGIRLALGAPRARVGGGVVAAAAPSVLLGAAAGVSLAVGGLEPLSALLPDAHAGTTGAAVRAVAIVAATAALALAGPVVTAARRDPRALLRED